MAKKNNDRHSYKRQADSIAEGKSMAAAAFHKLPKDDGWKSAEEYVYLYLVPFALHRLDTLARYNRKQ